MSEPVLNDFLFMFAFLFFMRIAFRICNYFLLLFLFIIIVLLHFPYVERCKLVSAIAVFYI